MNRKTKCKIGIDLAMTVVLLLLMARQITGFTAHEWLGAGMFVLWIAHHVLNRRWFGSLRRDRHPLTACSSLPSTSCLCPPCSAVW